MLLTGFLYGFQGNGNFEGVRDSVYAGAWYPDNQSELQLTVSGYLEQAKLPDLSGNVIGLVAPHAGYIYSGSIAAYSYKTVEGKSFDTVILIGNAHREAFQGAVIDCVAAYQTPLGKVEVDIELAKNLQKAATSVTLDSHPHRKEHSLEIQLPFLQKVLKNDFKILPILFGYHPDKAETEIVTLLPELIEPDKRILLVASTDLTHYPSYSDAKRIDQNTIEIIASLNHERLKEYENFQLSKGTTNLACVLCGGTATRTVMRLSRMMGADKGLVLKYGNSGDIAAGDRNQVVGYGSIAFIDENKQSADDTENNDQLTDTEKKELLKLSRDILVEYVTTGKKKPHESQSRLARIKRGVFVTLNKGNDLRGCIGYIEPLTTCMDAVIDNTISSCSRDPRFTPVNSDELKDIQIEISVLSPAKPIDDWKQIVIGKHGIILEKNRHRSVFLPQVAPEQGWDVETTLMYLSLKAGLPADGWVDAQLKVFEAEVFHELTGE